MTAESNSLISKKALVSTTVAIWLVVCLAYELHRIASFLALPPSGDLYAHDWGFQLFAFAFSRFPIWLLALFAILAVEFTLLKRRTPQI